MSRSAIDFSGLGGIGDGPSHSENVCCAQTNQYFRSFLEDVEAVCSRPAMSPKARVRHGMGLSVPFAKVTYTSVMASLMPKST